MKHVGEAVKDFGLATGSQNPVIAIGIAPWGCIQNRELLINDDVSQGLTKLTNWPGCPAKTQISLQICSLISFCLVLYGWVAKVSMLLHAYSEDSCSDWADAQVVNVKLPPFAKLVTSFASPVRRVHKFRVFFLFVVFEMLEHLLYVIVVFCTHVFCGSVMKQ